jgi:glycosyltransferase involved in cell wall biosynthesis
VRLLFLTPQLPFPADKGTRIRNLGLIQELARRHEVGVLSLGDPADATAIDGLSRVCRVVGVLPYTERPWWRRIVGALADSRPDLGRRLESSHYVVALREALAEPWDVVQVEALEMAPHWFALGGERRLPPVVLDAHNCEWILQERLARADLANGRWLGGLYSTLQAAKLRRYEGAVVAAMDAVVAVSAADAAALRHVGATRRVAVVPNGVDTTALPLRDGAGDGQTVLFTGTMDYRPNADAVAWFVEEVWPLVRGALPEARFEIVGRAPTARVRALAQRPGVEVVGEVVSMASHFARAAAYVAPLRVGGGSRLKLLEAVAHGVPVVTTSRGAEGIAVTNGLDAEVADDTEGFSEALIGLLARAERGRELAGPARRLVEERYDWRALVPPLERLYEELVGAGAPRAVAGR